MEYMGILLVAAVVFGLCFLVDKGFTRLFRGKSQHQSGLSVRLNKKIGAFGVILMVLGVAAILVGLSESWVMSAGGGVVILLGIVMVVYYMTYGIFYDEDGFVYTTFGKKSVTYRYNQIRTQQLYVIQGGNLMVELHMTDGSAVMVQLHLNGATAFLNKAFSRWCHQRGIRPEGCDFHDPENSCWFPKEEEL